MVEWLGASPQTVDELLAAGAGREDGLRAQAAGFLREFLAGGPRDARDVWEAAPKAGFSERTIQRAKRDLGIHCRRVRREGRPVSYWLLPSQELSDGLAGPADFDSWLVQLCRQHAPGPTPNEEGLEEDFG